MGPVGPAAGRPRLRRLDHGSAGRRAAVAAGRPLEPRQEHLPDGAGLEPRHDRLRLRRQLRRTCWPRAAWSALGEAAYGTVGAALLASLFPPRMRSTVLGAFLAAGMLGSVLGVVLGGFIAERWGWQAGFGAVGVPGPVPRVVFLLVVRDYKTVALPPADTRRGAQAGCRLHAVATELLRPRTALDRLHRRRPEPAGRLDDLRMAAELPQPLLRPRAGPGRAQDRASWCWPAASAR